MKQFTYKDIKIISDVFKKYPDYQKIYCDHETELEETETPRNRSRSGYGSKIPTSYKINYNGRKYRIYCRIYSNNGTCYFIANGQEIIVG